MDRDSWTDIKRGRERERERKEGGKRESEEEEEENTFYGRFKHTHLSRSCSFFLLFPPLFLISRGLDAEEERRGKETLLPRKEKYVENKN